MKVVRSTAVLGALGLLASGCASGVSAVYVKDDITYPSYIAQLKKCYADARKGVPIANHPTYQAGMPLAASAGVGFAAGFAEGWARAKRESEYSRACMQNLGYDLTRLNAADKKAYNEAKTPEAKTEILRRVTAEVKAGAYVTEGSEK